MPVRVNKDLFVHIIFFRKLSSASLLKKPTTEIFSGGGFFPLTPVLVYDEMDIPNHVSISCELLRD